MQRLIAMVLAGLHAGNGVFMLVSSSAWLSFVVGREVTVPPASAHFVFDVGWAFIASALGFLLFAFRPQQWGAAAIGAAFPLLHALMHVASLAQGHSHRPGFELVAIVVPALLGLLVLAPSKQS